MYTDFIQYRLADGVTHEQLKKAAHDILDSWMKNQEGFLGWQINGLQTEGEYIDVVQWRSKEDAKKAEESMQKDLPIDNPWYACYDMSSISAKSGDEILTYII